MPSFWLPPVSTSLLRHIRLLRLRRLGDLLHRFFKACLVFVGFQGAREFPKLLYLTDFIPTLDHRPFLRLGADALGDYAAFTDESSISGHRFMLVGGVLCRSAHAQEIHEKMCRIRRDSRFPQDSIQWKHFHAGKFATYKKAVDLFLEENASHRLDFQCLVVDTHKLNHGRFNEGDGETFFQKIMYQTAVAWLKKYENPPVLRLFHGRRESRYDLDHVRSIINAGMAKTTQFATYRPLRQFEYMTVQESGLHQIADVMLGAVSYQWNPGLRRPGGRKQMLGEYIQAECCASTLGRPTPMSKPHFDIWELKLR